MFEIRPLIRRNNSVGRYNPFRGIEELEKAFFGSSPWSDSPMAAFRTDIRDLGDSFLLEADMPGINKEDIHIDVDNDRMTISAERHSQHEDKDEGGRYITCERSYGSYQRSFDMSGIDVDKIKAEYVDGVLKLTMPKKQEEIPSSRRLSIE